MNTLYPCDFNCFRSRPVSAANSQPLRRLCFALMLLLAISIPYRSHANHILGGTLNYVHKQGTVYTLVLQEYLECSYVGVSKPTLTMYAGRNGYDSCGSYNGLTLTKISAEDVTAYCDTNNIPCGSLKHSFSVSSFVLWTYTTDIDLSKAPFTGFNPLSKCGTLTFVVTECCRNFNITTGAAGESFAITCTMDLYNLSTCSNSTNSSPRWLPMRNLKSCCNQPVNFNPVCSKDEEHDSILFQLKPAWSDRKVSITYAYPYSYKNPVSVYCVPSGTYACTPNVKTNPPRGFYFDSTDGSMLFTPVVCNENAIVSLIRKEFRKNSAGKWVLISTSDCDIFFQIQDNCGYNFKPVISSPRSDIYACAGDTALAAFNVMDNPFAPYQVVTDSVGATTDSVRFRGAKLIRTQVRTINNADYLWKWGTQLADTADRSAYMYVYGTDKFCPKPLGNYYRFVLHVGIPGDTIGIASSAIACNGISAKASYKSGKLPPFYWQLQDSVSGKILAVQKGTSDFTASGLSPGTYKVSAVSTNIRSCFHEVHQFVRISTPLPVISLIADTGACAGDTASFRASIQYMTAPYKYAWRYNYLSKTSTDSAALLLIPNIQSDISACLKITDSNQCVATDINYSGVINSWTRIKYLSRPDFITSEGVSFCAGDTATISASLSTKVALKWNTGDTQTTTRVTIPGTYTAIATAPDGCSTSHSVLVSARKLAMPYHSNPITLCTYKNAVNLYPYFDTVSISSPRGKFSFSAAFLQSGSLPANPKPGKYSAVLIRDSGHCQNTDTFGILVNAPVKPAYPALSAYCRYNKDISLLNLVTVAGKKATYPAISFSGNAIKNNTFLNTGNDTGFYRIAVIRDSSGCVRTDSMDLYVAPKPTALFSTNPAINTKDSVYQMVNLSSVPGNGPLTWNWNFGRGNNDSSSLKNPVVHYASKTASYQTTLVVSTTYGCRDTFSQQFDIVPAGISGIVPSGIKLTPDLVLVGPDITNIDFRLFANNGQLVCRHADNSGIGNCRLSSGIYVYQIAISIQGNPYLIQGKIAIP